LLGERNRHRSERTAPSTRAEKKGRRSLLAGRPIRPAPIRPGAAGQQRPVRLSACLPAWLSEARPALRPSWVSGALCGDVWVDPVDSPARARGGARGAEREPRPTRAARWIVGLGAADATWATRTDSSVARARARSDDEARGGLCMATRRAGLLSCRDVPFAVSVAAPPARGSTLGFGWPVTPGHLPNG
jgi:hypothetical protein